MREELDGRLEQKQIIKATRGREKQSDSRNASEKGEKKENSPDARRRISGRWFYRRTGGWGTKALVTSILKIAE